MKQVNFFVLAISSSTKCQQPIYANTSFAVFAVQNLIEYDEITGCIKAQEATKGKQRYEK